MFSSQRILRAIAIIYAGVAFGILHYWWQFHRGDIFPILELSKVESNIYQLYLLEKGFYIVELALSLSLIICSLGIWFRRQNHLMNTIAAINAGASVSLAGVSLSVGYSSGLYRVAHDYADIAFEADLSLFFVGFISMIACVLLAKKG